MSGSSNKKRVNEHLWLFFVAQQCGKQSQMCIILHDDIMELVAKQMAGEEFFLALSCRVWYDKLKQQGGFKTPKGAMFTSVERFLWIFRYDLQPHGLPRRDIATCTAAAASGNLPVLRWLCEEEPCCPWNGEEVAEAAARGGHLEILQWAIDNGWDPKETSAHTIDTYYIGNGFAFVDPEHTSKVCDAAAGEGHLSVLEWLIENDCEYTVVTYAKAAEGGHIEVFKCLNANGLSTDFPAEFESSMHMAAARGGHIEMLQYLRGDGLCGPWNDDTFENAAEFGQLKVLQFLHDNECPWSQCTCYYAAYGGHIEVLEWLRSIDDYPWRTDEVAAGAAIQGHLHVLQWLKAMLTEAGLFHYNLFSGKTYAEAAEGGKLDVLRWLHDNRCPCDERACAYAASKGHLKVLQWLRLDGAVDEEGWSCSAPWDETACACAASGGHLEVLQWLHDKGCPMEKDTCAWNASQGGHDEVLQWLCEMHD